MRSMVSEKPTLRRRRDDGAPDNLCCRSLSPLTSTSSETRARMEWARRRG